MILLDTNVVSEAMKPQPHASVHDWLDAQAAETLFLSSVTIAELSFGIGALPDGRRKDRLAAALDGVMDLFAARILPFDTSAARRYADLAVKARAAGKGFPYARWLYRRDRRRARVRRGIARHECVQGRRSDGDRSLDRDALTGGELVPLADSTIHEMEQRGEFPRRFALSPRCIVWTSRRSRPRMRKRTTPTRSCPAASR